MIKPFKCKETERIFWRLFSKKLPQNIQRSALKKLWMINRSVSLDDLNIPPNNKLESLSGDRKGQHSIRINEQWQICFKWKGNDAFDVEIVDYH
ncbi:MAG: type II toxin-antitoxin system RelE/ParE family toxin [Deltaproteobacteria bacterium]|nr:type II toxin-antitoxin system RelE/ParE family toxin [Deltaproteobacteria bacterium]